MDCTGADDALLDDNGEEDEVMDCTGADDALLDDTGEEDEVMDDTGEEEHQRGGEGGSCRIDNPSRSASSSEGGGELITWDEDEVGFNGGARQQAGGVEEGQADAHQGPYAVLLGSGAATPAPAWQAGCDAVHVCTIQKIAATLSGHESRREPDTVSSFETSTVQLQDAWAQSGEFDDVHPMWKRDGGERRV